MNIFFTFCFDIGRISKDILLIALKSLIKSLNYFENNYKLYIFTNIQDINVYINFENIIIINETLDNIQSFYREKWLNLSFYKFTKYKELVNQLKEYPIWIDCDTLVCRNIDHLKTYSNFFIQQGSNDITPMMILKDVSIETNKYIQGDIWKLDSNLINKFTKQWDELIIKPQYDFQGLVNYMYHYKGINNEINIIGKDIDKNTINGLQIYNQDKLIHPDIQILKSNMCFIDNKIIHLQTFKEVQFMSFTFYILSDFIKNNYFELFTDKDIRYFLRYCGLINTLQS